MCNVYTYSIEAEFRLGIVFTYPSRFNFLLLFVDKLLRNSGRIALSRVQHGPQLAHEQASVLPVEKSGQVDLHLARVRVLISI